MMIITPVGRLPGQSGAMAFLELTKNQKALEAAVEKIEKHREAANKAATEANARIAEAGALERKLLDRGKAVAADEAALNEHRAAQDDRDAEHEKELGRFQELKDTQDRKAQKVRDEISSKKANIRDRTAKVEADEKAAASNLSRARAEMTKATDLMARAEEMKAEAEKTVAGMKAALGA